MMKVLYIAVWTLCICASLIHCGYVVKISSNVFVDVYSNKRIALLEALALVLTFLLITSNHMGEDIYNYCYEYDHVTAIWSAREPLYSILKYVFSSLGITFYVFRAVITFIFGLLAVKTLKYFGTDICLVLIFYLPSMIFMDSMQFRNAVAWTILIWSLRYLLYVDRKSKIKFIICTLLAIGIHTFYFIVFLLFGFYFKSRRKKIAYLVLGISIAVSIITFLNGNRIPGFSILLNLILSKGDARIEFYTDTSAHLGWMMPFGIHFITTIYGIILEKYVSRSDIRSKGIYTNKQILYIQLVNYFNMILFVTVPTMMMSVTYYRMIRGAFIINVILGTFVFGKKRKLDSFQLFTLSVFTALTILWFVWDIKICQVDANPLIKPVFEGVWFWLA